MDEISRSESAEEAWFQRCSGARLFHKCDVVKSYLFELQMLVGLRGAVGYLKKKKKKNEIFIPFFPPVSVAAAAAADGDQRKVTEGKMHIEKALGNIWCRRQSRLYHSSGGGKKKIDAEKYGWPLLRQCMYHSVGFISKMPIWEVHLPPLSGVKWRLCALICSARLLLETLNTCQSSPETCWTNLHCSPLPCPVIWLLSGY